MVLGRFPTMHMRPTSQAWRSEVERVGSCEQDISMAQEKRIAAQVQGNKLLGHVQGATKGVVLSVLTSTSA